MKARQETRPSPFFLASATSSAFVLLISVVFSTSAVWHPGIFNVLNTDDDLRPGVLLCFATLILLSAAQYWLGPAWRIRRRRLRPIDPDEFPALHEELGQMASQALGDGRVRFLLDMVNPAVDGLAFGRAGRRYIVLSRGLLTLFERDGALFRAVVLHELAHVRNRDLDITAAALALWRTYFFVVLVPTELLGGYNGVVTGHPPVPNDVDVPYSSGTTLSWLFLAQFTGLIALSWLTRFAVLRARELEADARVLEWQPDPTSLRRLFDAVRERRRERRWSLAALRRRTHPDIGVRTAALTDPGPLLRQGFVVSFALGACFSLNMDPATSLTAQVRVDRQFWPAEVFVLVMAVTLGICALRAAVYARATGSTVGLSARLGLALGLPIGWGLSPGRLVDHGMQPFPVSVQLAGLLALALAGWLLGMWVEWVAKLWAPRVHAAARPSRTAVFPVVLVVLVVLLSARMVYSTQMNIIVAHVTHVPDVTNPLALVLGVVLMTLAMHYGQGVWLPASFVLLTVPWLGGLEQQPATRPPRPAWKRGLPGLLVFLAVWTLAAILVATGEHAVDQILSRRADWTTSVLLGAGGGLAAAVAYQARSLPIVKGALATIAFGWLLIGLAAVGSAPISWQETAFILGRLLEAAVVAGLVVCALSRLRAPARRIVARRHKVREPRNRAEVATPPRLSEDRTVD